MVIKRGLGVAAAALAITIGMAAPAHAAGWKYVRVYPATTAGMQQCQADGKSSGTQYKCEGPRLRHWELYIWVNE
ncbi:hypothetical protein DEF23_15260 [Marinitenerispora sediminis]|uniref:DUF4189 domain-containing protein n=2 Tax=Marinitenerispora sediminis TaxID=1931232 RepID=A0A368T8W6_9ACTN|nr:hypothetical protein DEF28_14445 [Marinitenerispora sediminis]RCV54813.1 hypothetical protein DEF23_15260 [Marinitenerispora sediminis]RCV58959.1 hypothetical protein DEF24_11580 [Marinitenerispora sediminis]